MFICLHNARCKKMLFVKSLLVQLDFR